MTEEVKNQEAQTAPATEPVQEQASGPELNVNDLSALRSIVDVATQRGAFKATELEAVGKVYNRLNSFLESVTKKD